MGEEATLMDDLAAAWDASEDDTDVETTESTAEDAAGDTTEEPTGLAAVESTDDTGEEGAGEPDDAPDAGSDGLSAVPGTPEEGEGEPDDAGDPEPDLGAPPPGLSPAAREAWKETPEAVKADIAKREADYEAGITKYSADAQRAQAMDSALEPFQQFFAMNGGAQQTLPGVLQTAAVLQMGAPLQKAQTMANMIQQFGVDVGMLDKLLVGDKTGAENDPNSRLEQLLDQRLQPITQQLSEFQQNNQQAAAQAQQAIDTEVQTFANDPKNEFYADVRNDMADIMDLAANRGQQITLKEAYDKACQLRPDISQILAARKANEGAKKRKKAASTIHSPPSGPGSTAAPDSLRDSIAAAWDNDGKV